MHSTAQSMLSKENQSSQDYFAKEMRTLMNGIASSNIILEA
jgi:hypothetical protein